MEVAYTDKVGEIVAKDIRTAHVFKKHGIDFCCGGGVSLEKACANSQVDIKNLSAELANATSIKAEITTNFDSWSPAELCDYIQEKHHSYVRQSIPMLSAYAEKVATVHGHHHPELKQVEQLVKLLCDDLLQHLMKEENILFPWIRVATEDATKLSQLPFGKFENPISVMENDHDAAGDIIKEIAAITNNFELPDYACNTWRAYFHLLQEFQDDLFMHIHLENNVLHPKVRALDAAN